MQITRRRRVVQSLLVLAVSTTLSVVGLALPASAAVVANNTYQTPGSDIPERTVTSPDSKFAYSVTDSNVSSAPATIQVFDLTSRTFVASVLLTGHLHGWGVTISPDGRTLPPRLAISARRSPAA